MRLTRLLRYGVSFLRYIRYRPAPPAPLPAGSGLLAGRTALITGAGRNIGRAIALEMARHGANVLFTDIDAPAIAALEAELADTPVRVRGFRSDISRPQDIEALCARLESDGERVDILVHNAAAQFATTTFKDHGMREWRAALETNLIGPVHLSKRIARHMMRHRLAGCIVFISSIHQWTVRRHAHYSASKAAVGMYIKELALDLAPYDIRVNGIAPGWVATGADARVLRHRYTPLYHQSIHPTHIGRAVVMLASDHYSRCTTGTVLTVDGGLSLYNHVVDGNPPRVQRDPQEGDWATDDGEEAPPSRGT